MIRRRARSRGYTAVEVLTAMMLLAVGAAGVIGMQKVTIQGGVDARRLDIASNIAHEWAAKLERDAAWWTLENTDLSSVSNVTTATFFLKDIGQAGCTGTNWCLPLIGGGRVPPANLQGCVGGGCVDTFAYDSMGRPLPAYTAGLPETEATFCVQYRLNYIVDGIVGTSPHHAIRAEIRVVFNRLEYGPMPSCTAIAPDPSILAPPYKYHYVYLTTLIRRNPIQ
jgi:type IV pilus assembly protein PilV